MENPIKIDDLGGKPTIYGNTQLNIVPSQNLAMETPSMLRKIHFLPRLSFLQVLSRGHHSMEFPGSLNRW